MSNKFLLIVLGIVTVVGLTYIIFSATQDTNETSSPSAPTSQLKEGRVLPPVKDKAISGQIIVKFKPQYTAAQINRDLRQYHLAISKTIEGINQTVIKVPKGQEDAFLQKLKNDPFVEQGQRDYTTHAFLVPNDPKFNLQYAFKNTGQAILGHAGKANADIHVEDAWSVTEGNGVKVAILDTGINLNQPDLAGKVVLQKSFVSGASTVEDGNGHGTHVAGIVAADTNNGVGIAGTCPGCQLLIGKVLDDSGSGTTSEATAGITWAADNGAKVISMSLGTTESQSSPMYNQAVSYALSKGAIVVAAAGNDGVSELNYPAAATGVVSVAATTNTDAKASYSNFGNWVQIAAPGDNILSTGPTHSFQIAPFGYSTSSPYYYLSGTSMATPIVSGIAALVASTSFGTTPQALINRLYSTADKISGTGSDWINGRINAQAAVGTTTKAVLTPTPKNPLITPTLFCVGGTGKPPCATIPPTAPTGAAPSIGDGGGSNPSTAPSTEVSPGISGSPVVSNSPSGSPIAIGNPGTVLPCPSQNQTASLSVDNGGTTISAHGHKHHKHHHHKGGFLSQLFKFLLQLILKLLQLIGINPCGGTGTPTVTPNPSQPSNAPSQSVSTVPPVSSSPSNGATNPTAKPVAGQPTAKPNPTSALAPVTSGSCTNPSHILPMNPGNPQDGITIGNFYITNDTWNASKYQLSQTMSICDSGNWFVTATMNNNANDGAVKTYPNVHQDFSNKPVSSFKTLTSTFAESSPNVGIWEAAYDIWTAGNANEIMIWTENHGQSPSGSKVGTASLGGQTYTVWKSGGYIAFVDNANVTSGNINILDFFSWMSSNGVLSNATLAQVDYGWELVSTNNTPATFRLTNFTLTAN